MALPIQQYVQEIMLSVELFEDAAARDYVIFDARKKSALAIVNAGLKPWGRAKVRYVPPDLEDPRYINPCTIRCIVMQRAIDVITVWPEDWDTCSS